MNKTIGLALVLWHHGTISWMAYSYMPLWVFYGWLVYTGIGIAAKVAE